MLLLPLSAIYFNSTNPFKTHYNEDPIQKIRRRVAGRTASQPHNFFGLYWLYCGDAVCANQQPGLKFMQ